MISAPRLLSNATDFNNCDNFALPQSTEDSSQKENLPNNCDKEASFVDAKAPSTSCQTRSTLASTVSGQSNPFALSEKATGIDADHGASDQNELHLLQRKSVTVEEGKHCSASLLNSEQACVTPHYEQRASNPFSESSIADRVKSRRGRDKRLNNKEKTGPAISEDSGTIQVNFGVKFPPQAEL